MTDEIRLLGLTAGGFHGVLPQERRDGQTFRVDLTLHLDTRRAAATDDLADTVDYSAVASDVVAVIEGEPVNLIETLAQHVATACLAHPGVDSVDVIVHKPDAPVGVRFDDVVVRITRP